MPTIACGDDDPLPVNGGPPNTITKPLPTPTLERPRSGRGKSTSSSTTSATNFEDKFKALSQRLGTPSAVSNNNNHHEDVTSSEAMISSMTERSSNNNQHQQSALEILKGGNFSLAQILHQQNQKERNTNSEPGTTTNTAALLSDLASEFATEFKEIDNYHYNLEKERENKERQEELLQKKRYREELKKQKMLLREHKKLMDLEHGGVENHEDHDDDRRTTYSTTVASTMFQNRNQSNNNNKPSTANSQVRTRDDLYEIPLSISSAAGPMKRRKDGAVKATTGYRKMFSNNNNQPNNNSSGYQNGVAPLMEKISSVSLSTTRVRSPQPSFVSSSRASDYYMMENNTNNDDDGRQSTTNMTSITNRKPATATTTRTSSKNKQLHRFATDNISVAASDAFSITAGKRKTKNIVPIHNKVAAASSVARSSNNTRNVASSSSRLPQSHNHQKEEQQNQKENDEDDQDEEEEEEEEDILLEDEGAIRFCCFKVCSRNRKTGEFECSVCKKSFSNAVEDDDQKEKHSMEIQAGTYQSTEDGENPVQHQERTKPPPSSAEGQFDRPIIPPNVKYSQDDETGEAEQQRLFQLAVLQWRNTSSSTAENNSNEEGKLSHNSFDIQRQLVEPDYELELEQKRRCPDVSEFLYFSKLWDGLMMRAEDDEDDDDF